MRFRQLCSVCIVCGILASGCAKYSLVPYGEVESTNSVEITLTSGEKLKGTVLEIEPHQIVLLTEDLQEAVPKTKIRSVKRRPPVYDDFGRGISEEDIASVQTNRNAIIYGAGGGALSLGASFFLGSLAANSVEQNSGLVLGASAVGGGALGTWLFVRAGKAKDRRDAIERICELRRSEAVQEREEDAGAEGELKQQLDDERKKHEELRKEREKLLRELEGKKKKKG